MLNRIFMLARRGGLWNVMRMVSVSHSTRSYEWITLAVACLGSIAWLVVLLLRCDTGLDLTDEGYYLNSLADPWLYPVSLTQFGFIYHPLYRLLDGDIALLRAANILLTYGLAFGLCLTVMRPTGWPRAVRMALSATLALSACTQLQMWLVTPNYNSLTLQALLLAAMAMLWAQKQLTPVSVAGWVLLGMAGVICFMAKASSAALLAVIVAVVLGVTRRLSVKGAAVCALATVSTLLLLILVIDGSISAYIARIHGGFGDTNLLLGSSALEQNLKVGGLRLTPVETALFYGTLVVVCVLTWAMQSRHAALRATAMLLSLIAAGATLVMLAGFYPSALPVRALLFVAIPAGMVIAVALRNRHFFGQRQAVIALCFLLLPCAFAFGTASSFWRTAGGAAIFWAIAAAMMVTAQHWRTLLPVVVIAQLLTGMVLWASMAAPYRQAQPIAQQQNRTILTPGHSQLYLAKDMAQYIDTLSSMLRAEGFTPGDGIIDLTGRSPTSVYAVGGKAVGLAWMIGGYPGSPDFVRTALQRVPCITRQAAWVITEPRGTRPLPSALLENFPQAYQEIGAVMRPEPQPAKQYVYKPRTTAAAIAARCAREAP